MFSADKQAQDTISSPDLPFTRREDAEEDRIAVSQALEKTQRFIPGGAGRRPETVAAIAEMGFEAKDVSRERMELQVMLGTFSC